MGDGAVSDIRRLAGELSSAEAAVRGGAAEALARVGEDAAPAAVELLDACGDTDATVREWVVAALEGLGAPPIGNLPAILPLASSTDPLTAYWALTLLGRLGPEATAAAEAIGARLAAGSPLEVRQRAAWALARLGPGAAAARESLRTAAGDADPRLARLATEALAAAGG